MASAVQPVGDLLRQWRRRRHLSQLDLATEAEISSRHLSFVETGRSHPSREMILHLCEYLDIPVRERNVLLVAAGYAPVFAERPLEDPALGAARKAIDLVLEAQKPYPAFALDRHWNIMASNAAIPQLYTDVAPFLLEKSVNALRLSLHPQGLAPRILNLAEWRAHLLARLRRQIQLTADVVLIDLHREISHYSGPARSGPGSPTADEFAIGVPIRIATEEGPLSFFSTTTVFGTPVDITLSELALESFFPADKQTPDTVRRLADRLQNAQ